MRLFPLAAALLAAALPAYARAYSAPMTLTDAVAYALDHNPQIAQQRAAVTSNEYALAKQKAIAFPIVDGTLSNTLQKSANYGGQFSIIGFSPQNVYSQNTAQLGLTYNLQTGGLAFQQLVAARATLQQSREVLANSENQIASTVTNDFYGVVARHELVALDQADLAYQNTLVRVAQAKERAGVAAGVDVLKAQVAQAKSSSTLVSAQADTVTARETLALNIGAPLDTPFAFPVNVAEPPLPNGTVQTLENIALASRPDVLAATEAVYAAQATRKGWNHELYPSVQINAGFGNQFSPTTQEFNAAGQPIPRQGSPGFWVLSAQSTFTLPIVDYGSRHYERVNDDAQVQLAMHNADQSSLQAQADVRLAYRNAETARAQLAYAREEARLGAESSRIARLQYEHGLISLADVLQTQQQTIVAQNDFVAAEVSYVDAVVKLRTSLGIFDAKSAVADLR